MVARRVVIIDLGMSNVCSVQNAFSYLGQPAEITSECEVVQQADVVIIPGVGSYRKAMSRLRERQLDMAIKVLASDSGRKVLGICLGMQLLGQSGSEDGPSVGLELIPGRVNAFSGEEVRGLKLPHVGFNSVKIPYGSMLYRGLPTDPDFYFVHAYRMLPTGLPGLVGLCNYGLQFAASYEYRNIFATQFHPEKSHAYGLQLLRNFLEC